MYSCQEKYKGHYDFKNQNMNVETSVLHNCVYTVKLQRGLCQDIADGPCFIDVAL